MSADKPNCTPLSPIIINKQLLNNGKILMHALIFNKIAFEIAFHCVDNSSAGYMANEVTGDR